MKRSIDTLRFVTSTHPAVRAPETKRTAQPVNEPIGAESLPGLDDTSVDELHDVLANGWVLHVILQRSGVRLRLLKDGLHDRVTHDFLQMEDA